MRGSYPDGKRHKHGGRHTAVGRGGGGGAEALDLTSRPM